MPVNSVDWTPGERCAEPACHFLGNSGPYTSNLPPTPSLMASSLPRSYLCSAPSLKKNRRITEISPQINYTYQISCPKGCISKSAAKRDYKVYSDSFFLKQS